MDQSKIKKKTIIQLLLSPIITGAVLFLPAGSFDYWEAWVFLVAIYIPAFISIGYFLKNDPKLIERRMRTKEKEMVQKGIITLITPLSVIGFILPGLDHRFEWSDVPFEFVIVANIIVTLSYIGVSLVMKENSYASRVVEVEKDQKVISTGPYAIVRHPMYSIVLPMFFAVPIALGSYWALIPFIPLPLMIIIRLLNEEKVLKRDLPGYKEYCLKTKYRLIPGIW